MVNHPMLKAADEDKAEFVLAQRAPDVLTCIANLSNDEVFTPPELANQMLDAIAEAWAQDNDGEVIWSKSAVSFLDPFTKSGVFLREIASRLIDGLAAEIPDLQTRVNHIFTKQVFGMGITLLTGQIARRSLYCSKFANGPHSVVTAFGSGDGYGNVDGHIWYKRLEHTWEGGSEWQYVVDPITKKRRRETVDGRCKYCGASQKSLDRDATLESHAYALIHTDDAQSLIANIFGKNMKFDVIIGNPPYQLDDGGFGTSAAPIYNAFVEQAKKLEPRLLTMVIPSRWFTGGKGLDEFREAMLSDNRVRSISDFLSASDVFPGVGLKGGVCYFLWNRDNPGSCKVATHFKGELLSTATRPLLEPGADVFIRFNEGVDILKKVTAVEGGEPGSLALPENRRFQSIISARRAFGFETLFKGKSKASPGDILIYQNGGTGYVTRNSITAGEQYIDAWKVFTGRAGPGTGNRDTYPHRIISTPFIGKPGEISSETYLCIGPLKSRVEAESVLSYLSCRLTRLLILLHKPSQDTTRKVYTFVPLQEWNKTWTDDELYAKYSITESEVEFVESMIRPLDTRE